MPQGSLQKHDTENPTASITGEITGEITVRCMEQHKFPALAIAKEENRFTNPDYATAKKMGSSTMGILPSIDTWRAIEGGIIFPRGYGRRLHDLMVAKGSKIIWSDKRVSVPAAFPVRIHGIELRSYQYRIINSSLETTQGVVVSPTGSGKTITALELIRRRSQRAVILVHSQGLMRQWRDVIRERMRLEPGLIGDGLWREGQEITVAMMQTLVSRRESAIEFAIRIGMVIVDECHHSPAGTFAEVIGLFPGIYRYGFTATPKRGDGLEKVAYRLLGDVVAIVKPDEVQDVGGIVPARVEVVDTGCRYLQVDPQQKTAWTKMVTAIVADRDRNQTIARLVIAIARKRKTLVMTDRVEHAEILASMIPGSLLVHGKLPAKEKEKRMACLETPRVVVGTKGLLGEGLDCSVWSCLMLASPISGQTPLLQAVGRVIRPLPGKIDGLVVDMVDSHPFALGAYKKRAVIYRKRKWHISKGVTL